MCGITMPLGLIVFAHNMEISMVSMLKIDYNLYWMLQKELWPELEIIIE